MKHINNLALKLGLVIVGAGGILAGFKPDPSDVQLAIGFASIPIYIGGIACFKIGDIEIGKGFYDDLKAYRNNF